MIRSFSFAPTAQRLACAALIASLAACSSFDGTLSSDKVDYRTQARQTTGLDVPPDLTQLARDSRSQVQGGSISASALQQTQTGGAQRPAATGTPVAVANAGDVSLQRSGDTRWLHTSQTPEQLWPTLRTFWQERGLELVKDDPTVGVMETNWAENRARLPQDIIRQTIGKVFDSVYSTGERDMYRTRLERSPSGGTDIYIVHRGMIEVYTTSQREQTAWQPRPSEATLEGEMLSRLLLKLGGKEDAAKAIVASSDGKAAPVAVPSSELPASSRGGARNRPLSEVPDSLQVNEGFERAWRRVGQSLDRHGFTIEDRDRNQGLFYLRYADPTQVGKEEPNFFQRLFKGEQAITANRYRVSVKAEGERSTVKVLDTKGQQQTDENAKRILNLLMDDLR
ncbi:outer membrane protein assembly factor BamC [Roseateles sp. DAIF2]|uniref:outer membrane protein assembly factor BamC n=1 Tax=Roseateles sp. DAIF2 TaxID=2714952 RepID=UPI00201DE79E|nr:outer membrane protein assembly factor BamC [Roseateles sp. DAIF2]